MARRPPRMGPGTLVVISTLSLGAALLLLAVAPSAWWAVGIALGVGAVQAPQLSAVMQVRDREAPQHARALVFMGATSLKTAAFALGAVLAAALVELGWRPLLLGSAVIEILAVMIGLLVAGRRGPQYRGSLPTTTAEG